MPKIAALRFGYDVPEDPTVTGILFNWRVAHTETVFSAIDNELKGEFVVTEGVVGFLSPEDRNSYVDDIVQSVFDNLTGRLEENVPEWLVPTQRGPLKQRTFKIPDELVEDFLESDAELVLGRHVRTMAAEVELANASKYGDPSLQQDFNDIKTEYQGLRKSVEGNKGMDADARAKELEKLTRSEQRDLKVLGDFRDMLRGTYRVEEEASNWGKATRLALSWNYMRLLGGVTLTSLADMSRQLGVHGLRNTMREGLPELVKALRGVSLSINEAKELGAVTEVILNSRLASLAEISDPYAFGSSFERMMNNATTTFSKLTLLGYWNDTMKGMASVMTQNRIMRNALAGGFENLDGSEKAYMGFMGIDEGMAERIARQFKKHGEKQGRTHVANSQNWDDIIAKQAYAAALNKDVDRTIVTKGIGDQPLLTRSNTGKLITQFKSFGLASHQRVLIAGLQERPQRMAEMLIFGTTLGMAIAYLKHLERGDVEKANALLDNPGLWITDGLDRTGIFSLPFEVSNSLDKANFDEGFGTGVPLTIKGVAQTLAGDERRDMDVSRFSSRSKVGAFLGPSFNGADDIFTALGQISDGTLKKSGANAMLRQIPGGGLPGVKTGLYVGVRPTLHDIVE